MTTDHLGMPKVITDSAGTIVKADGVRCFRIQTYNSSPDFILPIGFAGGIEEGATDLVRFGFRDYEPGTGRWTAKDPILFRDFLDCFKANFAFGAPNPVGCVEDDGDDESSDGQQ